MSKDPATFLDTFSDENTGRDAAFVLKEQSRVKNKMKRVH